MSLVINHNAMATNTANTLNSHYSNLAQSTQRLSSGLRINSAADDAAGLAIRELQRTDLAAYAQGRRNLNDGVSLVQVADGSLAQVSEILQRLTELAEQAATGTYDSTQRRIIADEATQLTLELDRMQKAANFNNIDLFTKEKTLDVHWGPEDEDYISLALQKVVATTIGGELDNTRMAYSSVKINGGTIGKTMASSTLNASTVNTLADQIVTVGIHGDRSEQIEVSSANRNNTAQALTAAILELGLDGIRYAENTSQITLENWSKAGLNGTESDMVAFDVAVQKTNGDIVQQRASFLIGHDEATTTANRRRALARIAKEINDYNVDSDLEAVGDTIKSTTGRTLSIGELEVMDSAGIHFANFSGAPVSIGNSTVPNSTISMNLSGVGAVTFEVVANTTNSNTASKAADALEHTLGSQYYNNSDFLTDDNYAWPHDSLHKYVVRQTGNDVYLTKIGSRTASADSFSVSNLDNNQTQARVNLSSELLNHQTTIQINGTNVTFDGTYQDAATQINAAGISNITARGYSNYLIIAETGAKNNIDIQYIRHVPSITISNFGVDASGTTNPTTVSMTFDGRNISYTQGTSAEETAQNMANAINSTMGRTAATVSGTALTYTKNTIGNITISNYRSTNSTSTLRVSNGNRVSSYSPLYSSVTMGQTDASLTISPTVSTDGSSQSSTTGFGNSTTVSVSPQYVQVTTEEIGARNNYSESNYTTTHRWSARDSGAVASTTPTDDGQRNAEISGSNAEKETILSRTGGDPADHRWISVAGVPEIFTDPEMDAFFMSSVSGQGTDGGAFYWEADERVPTDYTSRLSRTKAAVGGFDNLTSTPTLTVQGVTLSPTGTSIWDLYNAASNSTALAAAGVTVLMAPTEKEIYFINEKPGDISFDGGEGLTVRNIDYELQKQTLDGGESSITGFIPISQIDYRTQAGAQAGLQILRLAQEQVSKIRAYFGASQAVLENHTQFVTVQSENLQVAESRISDVDVATEMTNFVRQQILMQSAVAMLSQANSLPQMAIQLLNG